MKVPPLENEQYLLDKLARNWIKKNPTMTFRILIHEMENDIKNHSESMTEEEENNYKWMIRRLKLWIGEK